ncbi:hypothetical protein BDR06DRAFT_473967 [Suillus hirtellus]|nr:hypothetical protein BDR06DRAFT_473967 [Suillus hirtellus]
MPIIVKLRLYSMLVLASVSKMSLTFSFPPFLRPIWKALILIAALHFASSLRLRSLSNLIDTVYSFLDSRVIKHLIIIWPLFPTRHEIVPNSTLRIK